VVAVEPQRSVAARIRSGHHERYVAITGVSPTQRFRRIVDREGRAIRLPPAGAVLSLMLAQVLQIVPGDIVTLEVLEGHRPIERIEVTGIVDDIMGLSAYMDMTALHGMMREGDVANGAVLLVDSAHETQLSSTLKSTPAVAGAAFKRAVLQSFRDVMAANMSLSIFINLVFAGIIAFGVVYNAARVSLSERSRELASLRVLGFTRAEISLILMGELALLTLVALPVGGVFGWGLAAAMVHTIDSEVYRFPIFVTRQAVAMSFLGIIVAAVASGLIVRRKLDQLDLVAVLKIRE
jgi:putative ABC transport system permease protein